jgi:3-methyladenine DNA glycosylase AlkD
MSHPYLSPLITSFRGHKDPEAAPWMAAYMKNKFIFLGIKTPLRRELFRDFIKKNGLPQQSDLHTVISALWDLPEREFQYAAVSLFDKFRKKYQEEDILLAEKMIIEKSWWDTVDGIAAWIAGDYFRKFPEKIRPLTRQWMDSENIWLQRSALLFQLRYKKDTDAALLFSYIQELTSSKEFFIRKAIGWTLREYSKTNPGRVQQFVDITPMAALSKKEALKVIERKKKRHKDDAD